MKKLYFLVLVAIIGCATAKQSKTGGSQSKSFSQFKGDSLNYLTNNFIDNKQKYIGKKLNVLLNDLEFEVKSYIPQTSNSNINMYSGIYLSFYNSDNTTISITQNRKMFNLSITWENMVPRKEMDKLMLEDKNDWDKKLKKFFGQHIVGDAHLVAFPDSRPNKTN